MILGPKGLVRLLIEINDDHFKHLFIVCQNLKNSLLFGMDFANVIKLESIRITQEHHIYGIREENDVSLAQQ